MTTNDNRLNGITITIEDDSDQVQGESGCIRTRSQRGPLQCRVKEISIFVKILKLLVYELSNCLEAAMAFADDEDENETDGEVQNIIFPVVQSYVTIALFHRVSTECVKTLEYICPVSC